MKLWLNHILACPDDKSFPLSLKIFTWDSDITFFNELIKIYEKKTLINLKNPKNIFNIQYLDMKRKEIFEKNMEITIDSEHQNIINLIPDDKGILVKDYNVIKPVPLEGYIEYYTDFLGEFGEITDDSSTGPARKMLGIVKSGLFKKIVDFSKDLESKIGSIEALGTDEEKIRGIFQLIEPIFQDLLLLNYYLFLMEISEGILVCPKCKRWFPILKTIPRLMPKTMEKTDLDHNFKEKWSNKIPHDAI
jgi:uncharacterized protein YbaR (Trm112 family)